MALSSLTSFSLVSTLKLLSARIVVLSIEVLEVDDRIEWNDAVEQEECDRFGWSNCEIGGLAEEVLELYDIGGLTGER
jgi:hypothetical protein